jgi:CRISPR-associated endonuclease Csn1
MSTIWSFDLGKASIGEAVRDTKTNEFLHKASLLIPAEFASTKEAATRRRMWRTRQAHKAREAWLDEVWRAAGQEPLRMREPGKVDANGNPIAKSQWKKSKGKWVPAQKADYRLERESAPRRFKKTKEGERVPVAYPSGKAKDGAPATTNGDFDVCYNSALLRIKLLRGEKLEPWQIYEALHSAIQRRGYQTPPGGEQWRS